MQVFSTPSPPSRGTPHDTVPDDLASNAGDTPDANTAAADAPAQSNAKPDPQNLPQGLLCPNPAAGHRPAQDWVQRLGRSEFDSRRIIPKNQPQSSYRQQLTDAGRFLGNGLAGTAELIGSGLYNSAVRIAAGATSWCVLAADGLDGAVQYQQAFSDRWGYRPRSEGALAITNGLAPLGRYASAGSQWVRGYSERYLGDTATSVIGATGQFALEAGATVSGLRTVGSALESVAVNWGSGVPTGGLYSLQAGGMIVPEIRFVSGIRNDIMSALPEGASLVQTTRGGAAIVRFGDDAMYNIPMQANATAYSRVFADVRAMDTMGSTFTGAAQGVRNGYRFDRLPRAWQDRINAAPFPWLAGKWESAARGTYVHERVRQMVEDSLIPGAAGYKYMYKGPDIVPSSGPGLKYEITQQTPSLNAIVEHSRRYPNELLRYVTYK